ncbi:hypothetical protein [Curtobacterium sp. ISL-83]|uniref:hypothetical protein n=1 Tax=Curtobacterium sp. ISL-83 TaxID=2819145 RepID=UPI001BEB787B|nr:hypothetical protein [Curtobacterium sp. ISL-83]MBT2502384.1 hypothetical protein [Curtobacterium sp. ISL-83]
MSTWVEQLASIGGPEIGSRESIPVGHPVLLAKDGFVAFESALRVFPSAMLAGWNSEEGWRARYPSIPSDAVCFASDLFGNQFATAPNGVLRIDVESAEVEVFADSLEEWAQILLEDYSVHTGYALAHAWQATERPLKPGERLAPLLPFVLGGEYSTANLSALDEAAVMERFGRFAQSLEELPDGAEVTFDESLYIVRAL